MSRNPRRGAEQPRKPHGRPPAAATPKPGPKPGRRPASDQGKLWLYGQHAVEAALANRGRPCFRLLATEAAAAPIEAAARTRALTPEIVPAERIGQLLTPDAPHQGLALLVGPLPERDLEEIVPAAEARSLILALDQVSDPRNLGAILRTAAALGVTGVVQPDRRSAELNAACAKAASGALDIVPVVEVVNLARALTELKDSGHWVVGLDAAGPQPLEGLDLPARVVLVLGSEGEGLRRLVADSCDHLARLEIDPRMESLNVSVAAGVALYVLARGLRR